MKTFVIGDEVVIREVEEDCEKKFQGKKGIIVAITRDEESLAIHKCLEHKFGDSTYAMTQSERDDIYTAVLVKLSGRYSKIALGKVHDEFGSWYGEKFTCDIQGCIGTSAYQLDVIKRRPVLEYFLN